MSSTKVSENSVSCSAVSEDTRGSLAMSGGEIAMPEEEKIMGERKGK